MACCKNKDDKPSPSAGASGGIRVKDDRRGVEAVEENVFKLLIIGDANVGKSCLLLRFSDDIFTETLINSIGVDFKNKSVNINGTEVKLQIWDTAGQERFRTITSSYYRGATGIIIVYDITQSKTFDNIHKWLKEIDTFAESSTRKLLIGNKSDLSDNRVVETEAGAAMAKQLGIPFIETSAKESKNVREAFETISREIKEKIIDNQ